MGQEERDNHQEKETEQIKEMGALELDKDREKHRIQLLTIIGEIEVMKQYREIQKQQNMNIYFQSLRK